jgi:hypothetical protein
MSRRIAILFLCLALSAKLAHAAPEQWIEVTSPHFKVITDSSD